MSNNFEDLRKDYSWGALQKKGLKDNPIEQFLKWYEEYSHFDAPDSTAMVVSTIGQDGCPDARIVLLKGIKDNQFIFYTNYKSKKGKDLDGNNHVHLLFFWPEMERQVRVKGRTRHMSITESKKYFNSRPFESRVAAAVSPQSEVVPNRAFLEDKFFEILAQKDENEKIDMPEHWGGVLVEPFEVEFWQGRVSRLHDRIKYTQENKVWKLNRLAP